MFAEIEDKIVDLLTEKLAAVSRIAVDESHSVNTLKLPGVDVIIGNFTFTRVAQNYKVVPQVYVIVTFQNLRSVKDRRRGVYPVLQALIALLVNNKLGLAIDALKPKRCDNITEEKEADEGKVVFQIEFETGFIIEAASDAQLVDLLRIGLSYYLQDPADDGKSDAEDLVRLS